MGLSDDLKKSIASSIAAMAVEISRLEMVLMIECEGVPCAGVCFVPGNLLPHPARAQLILLVAPVILLNISTA